MDQKRINKIFIFSIIKNYVTFILLLPFILSFFWLLNVVLHEMEITEVLNLGVAFMTLASTVLIAISSDKTSKRAAETAEYMKRLEILNEGPKIFVKRVEGKSLFIANDGAGIALNFSLNEQDLNYVQSVLPLESSKNTAGGQGEYPIYLADVKLECGVVYKLGYTSAMGTKYITSFILKKSGEIFYAINLGMSIVEA